MLDNMLDFLPSEKVQLDDWVQQRQFKMKDAFERASKKISQKAQERKKRHEKHLTDFDVLKPGTKVLIRNRVKGRNKIQDVWLGIPYVVVERIHKTSAYRVRPVDQIGAIRTINGADLLDCSKLEDGSSTDDDLDQSTSSDEDLVLQEDFDTDDYLHPTTETLHPTTETVQDPLAQTTTVDDVIPQTMVVEDEEPQLRRSTRRNKGVHSNPHRLPKSVLQQSGTCSDKTVGFDRLALAVRDLGETLGKILSDSYLKSRQSTDS